MTQQPTSPTRSFPMKKLPRSDSNLSNLEDGAAPGSYGSFGEEKKPLLEVFFKFLIF